MPEETEKETVLFIRCSPELAARMKALAAKHDRSLSAEVRHLMKEAVAAKAGK